MYFSTPTPSDTSTVVFPEVSASHCCSYLATTSKDCVTSSQNKQPLEVESSTESLSQPFQDIPGVTNSTADCSGLAREVELLRKSTSISPESFKRLGALERKLARVLALDISRRQVKGQSKLRDTGSRVDVIVMAKPETSATAVYSNPTVATIRTRSIEPASHINLTAMDSNDLPLSPPDGQSSQDCICYSEQVTDIHDGKKKNPAHTFCPAGDSFQHTVTADRGTDTCSHGQHGSNPVSDSETVSLNGIKTQGYPSNSQSKEVGPISSNGVVPHHSLSLAISDPESPSSCKVRHIRITEGVNN